MSLGWKYVPMSAAAERMCAEGVTQSCVYRPNVNKEHNTAGRLLNRDNCCSFTVKVLFKKIKKFICF